MRFIGPFREYLKEYFRPELKKKLEIVKREKQFNKTDPNRRNWMLGHTYLCVRGFEQLRQEKNYNVAPQNKIIHYPDYKRTKKVKVKGDNKSKLEEMLKEELFLRGCNAGIHYVVFSKNGEVIAEAVPVRISSE